MKSLLVLAALVLVATSAHAQPKRHAPPPPDVQHAPPPAPAPTAPAAAPAHVSSSSSSETAPLIGTPALAADSTTSDLPLLQQKTEVRHGFHFEAFIDAEVGLVNKDYYPTRGFRLNDGAIYLSKDFGSGLSAMIDIPFASVAQDPNATTFVGTSIGFGSEHAQAFAQYMNGPWEAKAGQFDTMFGYEQNESRDRFFANAGLVKSLILPYTHVGLMGGYSVGGVILRAMVADPRDTGTLVNQNPEIGLQARYESETGLHGAVGFLFGDNNPKGIGNGSNQLIDVNLGLKTERLDSGLYFDDHKAAGADKHATGYGLQVAFAQTADLSLGARVEYATDIAALGGLVPVVKNAFSISVGPSYRWLPDVTLRGDLDFASISPYFGDNQSLFGAQGSLVLAF